MKGRIRAFIADFIGVIALFAGLYGLLAFGYAMGWA